MPRRAKQKLTHLDSRGRAAMVDVGHKPVTQRTAVAEGFITVAPATIRAITAGRVPKGEVLNTARLAGILAAKRVAEMIPLCHTLPLDSVSIEFSMSKSRIRLEATARVSARTGVEMEALTAVSVAALTIYDMCKAIDKKMVIEGIRLLSKTK